ncbi:MAG: NYN domain-containing protein [Nitrospirae bacterium]|nr:NYN domain-containing protein [Nitrospirota bacterium]
MPLRKILLNIKNFVIISWNRRWVISSIIIDGYNLIGIHHKDLESQRQKLIETLTLYKKIREHDMTVVFDGWKSGGGKEELSVTGGVKVIYSRLGEKADAVIKRILTSDKNKRQWLVVTSDRDIADHAWSCGFISISSEEFLNSLERPEKIVTGDFDLIEEEYEIEKKSSAKKLSKREKAKRRALSKL